MTVTLHKTSIHSKVDNYFDFTLLVAKATSKKFEGFQEWEVPDRDLKIDQEENLNVWSLKKNSQLLKPLSRWKHR